MDPSLSPTKWQPASLTTRGRLQGQHTDSVLGIWRTWPRKQTQTMSVGNHESLKTALFVLICIKPLVGGKPTIPRTVGGPARSSSWTTSCQVSCMIFGPDTTLSGWEGPMYLEKGNGVCKLWRKAQVPAAQARHQLSLRGWFLTGTYYSYSQPILFLIIFF